MHPLRDRLEQPVSRPQTSVREFLVRQVLIRLLLGARVRRHVRVRAVDGKRQCPRLKKVVELAPDGVERAERPQGVLNIEVEIGVRAELHRETAEGFGSVRLPVPRAPARGPETHVRSVRGGVPERLSLANELRPSPWNTGIGQGNADSQRDLLIPSVSCRPQSLIPIECEFVFAIGERGLGQERRDEGGVGIVGLQAIEALGRVP